MTNYEFEQPFDVYLLFVILLLLSTYYIQGTILGAEDTTDNKTNMQNLYFNVRNNKNTEKVE